MNRLPFRSAKPLIGMVHLLPLPGSPAWGGSLREVLDRALLDAQILADTGYDGLIVENFGDTPFLPDHVHAETIAGVAVIADRLRERIDLPLGINILRNDARAALAVAAVTGASFIRVNVHTGAMLTDQGWIEGRAHETLRLRAALDSQIAICADVMVKHALPPAGADLSQLAADTFVRGRADVLIVSGTATGAATDPADISAVKNAVPGAPVWIGSGVTPANVYALLKLADGAIVGSAIKADGHASKPVDPRRAAELVRAARALPQ
jgi:uncharacterized protein